MCKLKDMGMDAIRSLENASINFVSNLAEDLKRRDFTINAMAYNHEHGMVDLFDGQKDLKRHVIRCVGNPMERFSEDALRMLRAVRFAAQLNFEIEEFGINSVIVKSHPVWLPKGNEDNSIKCIIE